MRKPKVAIIDDTLSIRKLLEYEIRKHPAIGEVKTGKNGSEAIELVKSFKPDVMILDVEMPEMDGIEALKEIKKLSDGKRCKVYIFSSQSQQAAKRVLQAIDAGAEDFIAKPVSGSIAATQTFIKEELVPKLLVLPSAAEEVNRGSRKEKKAIEDTNTARSSIRDRTSGRDRAGASERVVNKPVGVKKYPVLLAKREILCIGLSTGGPKAIMKVLPLFPSNFLAPIVIVQHMPVSFTKAFAEMLDRSSKIKVVEAEEGMKLKPGVAYIAPGDFHMTVDRSEAMIHLNQGPKNQSCRPSVNVLFESVAREYGKRTAGIIMTGMGKDGLDGCLELKKLGCPVITQNEESCVVFGMPKAVEDAGLSDHVLPLEQIANQAMIFFR